MQPFNPNAYGPAFDALLAVDRRRPLDAGTPNNAAKKQLEKLSPETAFAHAKILDRDMAAGCVSGVWLLHDFLDESHTISQGIDTTSGSYWHAIMHRREGDFSNSKYWFRRVGAHAVLRQIREGYDPFAFVDECEAAVRGKRDIRDACLDIQQLEWERLFDYCYRSAIGRP